MKDWSLIKMVEIKISLNRAGKLVGWNIETGLFDPKKENVPYNSMVAIAEKFEKYVQQKIKEAEKMKAEIMARKRKKKS
jgi:hypothetical protein